MKRINLSEWAIGNQTMVLYLLLVTLLAGAYAYFQLPQKEDPDFTFKVMTVKVLWPGATARSRGSPALQAGIACAQRGAKRQPAQDAECHLNSSTHGVGIVQRLRRAARAPNMLQEVRLDEQARDAGLMPQVMRNSKWQITLPNERSNLLCLTACHAKRFLTDDGKSVFDA